MGLVDDALHARLGDQPQLVSLGGRTDVGVDHPDPLRGEFGAASGIQGHDVVDEDGLDDVTVRLQDLLADGDVPLPRIADEHEVVLGKQGRVVRDVGDLLRGHRVVRREMEDAARHDRQIREPGLGE